ncbi:DUF2726 domain-containing protein [Ectothiorhodospira mobilis]|uniref:DUF2726 domain-containing protein n=1 Tax=Ectothiorhodospira mobilis TaxID=195064 RepID=UPI001EE79C74|nr:DUF2726 domain-containing protein [Ectothiorhodospira mobilis]MCG5536161.1 DUF2726 domain-containing protein [Ectothiorhodospira mobilis]
MVEAILVLIFAGTAVMFYSYYNARVALPPPHSGCYEKHKRLLSDTEAQVLQALEAEYGNERRVLPKVNARDVVAVKPTPDQPLMEAAEERIRHEQFDFVLCGKDAFDVSCAVRCRSGERKGQVHDPDRFLAEVCEHLELPLARIRTDQPITQARVKARVDEAFREVQERAEARKAKQAAKATKAAKAAQGTTGTATAGGAAKKAPAATGAAAQGTSGGSPVAASAAGESKAGKAMEKAGDKGGDKAPAPAAPEKAASAPATPSSTPSSSTASSAESAGSSGTGA